MSAASTETRLEQQIEIDGIKIEMVRQGAGKQLLLLHSVDGINSKSPYFQGLAQNFDVVAPWHPGFGHSEWPTEFRGVDDLAYFHMTLAETLGLEDAVLVGCSFGGWIAAEIAVRSTERFSHLVLVDAYGIKVSDRETRDVADLYAIGQDELVALAFHDAAKRKRDYSQMSEHDLLSIARSREAFTYFGWNPYMHNPGLKRWLRRIRIPTLVMWGESDGIVKSDYGRAYASLIPHARFVTIPEAGHYPHLEQPEAFVRNIVEFGSSVAVPVRQRA
jgi:pimeloyl-ACP methyl ester carboxylesterase